MNLPVQMSSFSSQLPAALEDIVALYPTLGATSAHASRSAEYEPIATSAVLTSLYTEGYRVFSVSHARTRDVSKIGFEKHMIRMRHVDAVPSASGAVPEAVLINAHDGSAAWSIMVGLFRFICSNGFVIGDLIEKVSVRHIGNGVPLRVVEGTDRIIRQLGTVVPLVDEMRLIELTPRQRETFAERAHAIRFPRDEVTGEHRAPVSPLALLNARRAEDAAHDLWSTFNVVQENMIKGGLRGHSVNAQGRVRRSRLRAIGGIDGTVDVNRRLFDLATTTHRELIAA